MSLASAETLVGAYRPRLLALHPTNCKFVTLSPIVQPILVQYEGKLLESLSLEIHPMEGYEI